MTPQEKQTLKAILVTTSLYYGRKLEDVVVLMHVEDLDDLPFDQVLQAYKQYRRQPKNRVMPLPADIRGILQPGISGDQEALEASNKIVEAMSRCGWSNPDQARQLMGEIAWEVVVREGGWTQLCERTTNDNLPVLKAQWRELAKVVRVRQIEQQTDTLRLPTSEAKRLSSGSES